MRPDSCGGVADNRDGQDDRPGSDLAERHSVEELAASQPVVVVYDVRLHERDDHEAAPVGERADFEPDPGEGEQAAARGCDCEEWRWNDHCRGLEKRLWRRASSIPPQASRTRTSHGPRVAAAAAPAPR